jgi:hypothetical protein
VVSIIRATFYFGAGLTTFRRKIQRLTDVLP